MTRRPDLFARLSLDYADHPKIAALSDAAFRAHVEMILYARRYMTDGVIAKQIAKRWPSDALSELQANDPETPSLSINEDGDYVIHGFAEMQETREQIERKRRIRAEAGRKGGLARGKQSAKRRQSNLLSKTQAETETETEIYKARERAPEPDGFTDFWNAYPRRDAKGKARESYAKALTKTDKHTILTAARKYAQANTQTERKFIAMPTTWLNQERWDDDHTPTQTQPDPNSTFLDNLPTARAPR